MTDAELSLFVLFYRSKEDKIMLLLLAVWLEIDMLFALVNELLCI